MLKIHNPSDPTDIIPLRIDDNMRFVTHKYNGYDTLTFEIESGNPLYRYIAEEVVIEDEKNRYVVKDVDEHSDFVTVMCEVDLDEWKQNIIYEFRTTNTLLSGVLAEILPAGWSVIGDGQFTKRTTVEDIEGQPLMAVTPLTVLDKAASAYSCVFNFRVLDRILECIDPTTFVPSGRFFTDELNLSNFGFVGSSTGFATRLYAYGKKDENGVPLTFADINDGKAYVEDVSYSDKVISIGWSDERYTDAQSLMKAAMARLKAVSYPARSYTCDARNLDDDVWLYKVVTLIDRRRRTRVDHQIVEYKEYPNHLLDVVVLSKTAPSIESLVNRVETEAQERIEQETLAMQGLLQEALDQATSKITGSKGGNFLWIFDSEGRPVELVNLTDSLDINTAKSVWRWNASGLGHSNDGYNGAMTLALLADGSINASAITAGVLTANLIRAGILQSADGNFRVDLDTGEIVIGGYATSQDVENLNSTIDQQSQAIETVKEDMLKIQASADELSVTIQKVIDDGAEKVTTRESKYTFDDEGLKIAKAGEEMANKLDNTGMYVTRSDEIILQANNEGVVATDVTVRNYLIIGEHSRVEDYNDGEESNRTAIFHLG